MPIFFKNILKYGIIFLIMAYLLYDAFNHIDADALEGKSRWQFIGSYWAMADKWMMAASLACALASHILRAMRWKITLEPLGYSKISLFNATWAVLNGYFVNLFIPRGGEFSRPIALEKTEKVPSDIGIGTVVAERIIDLIFLILCISTVMVFQSDLILGFVAKGIELIQAKSTNQENGTLSWGLIAVLATIAIGTSAMIYILVFQKIWLNILWSKFKEFGKGFYKGLVSILQLEKKGLFIVYSLLIWFFYYGMIATLLVAFEQTSAIGFMGAISIFVVGGIAMALPLPGGTGSYHVMVSATISQLAGLALAPSIAIVTVLHGLHTVFLILLGGLSVYFISKNTHRDDNKK